MEPTVAEKVRHYMEIEFGNAGSRTHEVGTRAKQAVQAARTQVADVVACKPDEVTFTSGATESNNIAILGLKAFGEETGKKHIISTAIEHKAVLEPLEHLESQGWEVTLVSPDESGRIEAGDILSALRDDTLLVSVMHVNNETGIIQPIEEIADCLSDCQAYFHVDAAQSFGKLIEPLQNPRIDLTSISGHKVYGPKGIGTLIARRRRFKKPPLQPLMFGGGQERGLRPGTLPVPLIAGLGEAAAIAEKNRMSRGLVCMKMGEKLGELVESLGGELNGDQLNYGMPHILNFSIPGVNSEAAMVAFKGLLAASNGSACTSSSYTPSHVLTAMGLADVRIEGALRFSWCHMTEEPNWDELTRRLKAFM